MTRWMRVARGTLAAFVSTFVAAFSHAVAGGPLPGFTGLALCFAFSWLVCIALTGRRWHRMRLGASIAASQAMFHLLFSTLGGGTASIAHAGGVVAGHDHGAPLVLAAVVGHAHPAGDMLLAHLAAAIVTFLALAFGERSAATIIALARRALVSLLPCMPQLAPESAEVLLTAVRLHADPPRTRRLEFAELRHRGPPALLFA